MVFSKSKGSSRMDKNALEKWKHDIREAEKAKKLWLEKTAEERKEKPGK